MKISAVIICFNEEKNIADAVESVRWADEIVVVDSESTDRTREIASELGARVLVRAWTGFAPQKEFAVRSASNDWVFSLDADERVSPELLKEIIAVRERGPQADAFRIPRLSIYLGRAIRHGGWYPDRQLRLFDRRKGCWKDVIVHESVEMDAGSIIADLSGELIHYSVEDVVHHHRMIGERYAPLAAEKLYSEGRTTSPFRIAAAGPASFVRSYLLKMGFLDGVPGLAVAAFAGYNSFLKHLLLWEKQNRPGP